MREQTGVPVGAAPVVDEMTGGALFIITLSSSTTPIALEVPSVAELAGLAVFRSRKVEDGRDRFRLHLGYFESAAAAEGVLPVVREHFPAAWIGPAPNSGMGSLDDTSVAQFKFIKAPNTIKSDGATSTRLRALSATATPPPVSSRPAPIPSRVAAPPAKVSAPRASHAQASKSAATRTSAPGRSPVANRLAAAVRAQVPAKTPASAKGQALARAQAAAKAQALAKAQGAVKAQALAKTQAAAEAASPKATAPKPQPAAVARPAAPAHEALPDREVLNLLEGRQSRQPSRQEEMQPRERAAVIGAIQRFAVQLIWSTDPLNLASVPKLAIFDAYTLYKVQVDRAGRRWYGLRLGFFGDAVSARQVALYARSDFSAAAVVPVSDRECDRAAQAAVKDLPEAPPIPRAEVEMELIDVPRAAPKFDIGAEESRPARPAAVTAQFRPSAIGKAQGSANTTTSSSHSTSAAPRTEPARVEQAEKAEKTRRLKSTAELAADLQADEEPQFEMTNDGDPLNDTGVRHLAITVVNKKQSGIGSLFKRRGRRS